MTGAVAAKRTLSRLSCTKKSGALKSQAWLKIQSCSHNILFFACSYTTTNLDLMIFRSTDLNVYKPGNVSERELPTQ